MSNIVQAQCVRTSTSTHVHYVGRQGCPCRTLYVHKYSVGAQARRPTHNRCIAQAFHAKHCTKRSAYVQAQALMYTTYAAQTVRASTRTACTPKHAGLCTIGASPRLFMSNHCTTGTSTVVVVVVVVDSHIQRIVLATEETTVTQQVSHRPIKRQSRLWSQRGTKVNGSHHGDNPLLRPTGIQIATKSYAALQAMAPTNIKTVHQTSLLHSRATSIDSECCRLPTTSVLSKKPEKLRSNQF